MKQVILFMLIILNFIFISSGSPMIVWAILEMNMFLFIFMININNKKSSNISINYFIIQSFSSFLIMINMNIFYCLYLNSFPINFSPLILMMAIFIKLGLFPFHSWYISMKILPFQLIFLLSTIQKFMPLFLISQFNLNWTFMSMIIFLSSTYSSMKMLKTNKIKEILIYSSINNTTWFLFIIMINSNFFMIYFLIYLSTNFFLFKMLKSYNLTHMSSMIWNSKIKPFNKIILFSLMFMNSGIPPFSSFIYKMISIYEIMNIFTLIILIWLIMMTILNMLIYIKLILFINMTSSSFKSSSPKNIYYNYKWPYMIIFFMILISLPMMFLIIL